MTAGRDRAGLTETEWQYLIEDIREGACTPFVGAGASVPQVPLGSQLARTWADEYRYPLHDRDQLAQVAQYISVVEQEIAPKRRLRQQFAGLAEPDFTAPDDPHGLLADLGLPCYVTTNYDQFMFRALEARGREPVSEYCHWWDESDQGDAGDLNPTPATPLVYHLHGRHDVPQSMVLTEADYLDFLVRVAETGTDILPAVIRKALASTSLLFVGYSLNDWTTRVLLKAIVGSLGGSNTYPGIAVNLEPPVLPGASLDDAKAYLVKYVGALQHVRFSVFWGDARDFTADLRRRWEGARPSGASEPSRVL